MSKREDFHLTGYVDLKLFDMTLDTIYFEVFIKVVNKNLELIVSFPNIPTIAFVTKELFENVVHNFNEFVFIISSVCFRCRDIYKPI